MSQSDSLYMRSPKQARCQGAAGAWWYAERGFIEIHADTPNGHVRIWISKRALAGYIKRMQKARHG